MAKKGEGMGHFVWKHKVPLAIVASFIAGGAIEASNTQTPPQEVYRCLITPDRSEALCPDGTVYIRNKTIKVGTERVRRDAVTGNAVIITPTNLFTATGKNGDLNVYQSRLPTSKP